MRGHDWACLAFTLVPSLSKSGLTGRWPQDMVVDHVGSCFITLCWPSGVFAC